VPCSISLAPKPIFTDQIRKGGWALGTKRARRAIGHGEKGFTLIEILVVLAILGIIALIVLPNLNYFSGHGQEEACKMEDQLLKSIIIAYASQNQTCPKTIEDLEFYLENLDDIMGSYSFESDYPDCMVKQESCP
jgi:prepilin-type N-terminal cleavage/methylation domain-containing protein